MNSPSRPTVIVIGAGVIGLSCALKIQAKLAEHASTRDVEILLVAREWPGSIPGAPSTHSADYASMWAGAHVRPIPATMPQLLREAAWLKQTAAEFDRQVEAEPWCGVTRTAGVELLEAPTQAYWRQDARSFERESGLRGYRTLAESELPAGVVLGFEYETFCINSPLYCEHLLRKFVLEGGKTAQRLLMSEWEPFSMRESVLLVVNASGMGFGDPRCFPTRGQTVVTNLPDISKTVTRQTRNGWSFLIPRFFNGGTIVGGTKDSRDWRTEPDVATRNRLLAAGLTIKPYAHDGTRPDSPESPADIRVVADVVGRRPSREGGMRLEVEEQIYNQHFGGFWRAGCGKRHVIHAYGAGGRGFEISWGVADEVAALAAPLLGCGASVEATS